jgi:hypothetical protein
MAWTVSVRDVKPLEYALRNNTSLSIPEECNHNADVIWGILGYAPKVIPDFKSLDDNVIFRMAQSVAYLMRPDIVISGYLGLVGPNPFNKPQGVPMPGQKRSITFRNDPSTLYEGFQIKRSTMDDRDFARGAELFRCYSATLIFSDLTSKLRHSPNSMGVAYELADMTVHLLTPTDLDHYFYSPELIATFNNKLEREAEEV